MMTLDEFMDAVNVSGNEGHGVQVSFSVTKAFFEEDLRDVDHLDVEGYVIESLYDDLCEMFGKVLDVD